MRIYLLILLLALFVLAAACSGNIDATQDGDTDVAGAAAGDDASSPTGPEPLRLAFNAEMQPPDPDVFYEVEGNMVTQSLYEGLVVYAPDSPEIVPQLAASWEVSDDGLTYTFTLHEDVPFHDGTIMDADAWVRSFERRLAVDAAPAYMLADVEEAIAADEYVFEVTLAAPSSAFLEYLASPYGPRAISPVALAEHDEGDAAQGYLAANSAGTGPYRIASWDGADAYRLVAFDDYWGEPPAITNIEITIIPDIASQRLALEEGDLDLVTHGLPVADVETLEARDDFAVHTFPLTQKTVLSVNPNRPPFDDLEVRSALRDAFDRPGIVEDIFANQADPSTQMYPAQSLPEGLGRDIWDDDPSALAGLVAELPRVTLDLAYSQDEGGSLPRMAEILAAELDELGLSAAVRGLPISQIFELPALDPAEQPDLLLWRFNPDAVHPDTWARIFYITDGAVNFLNASVPAADAAMDEGLAALDPSEVDEAYGRAGELMAQDGTFLTFADNRDVMVARADLDGFTHWLAAPYTLRLADLRFEGDE